jgi:hypothetical protein
MCACTHIHILEGREFHEKTRISSNMLHEEVQVSLKLEKGVKMRS